MKIRNILYIVLTPYLYLFLAFSAALNAEAKQYYFHHLSSSDGLSHNSITAIAQDEQGLMWFGTGDGLNRYDGKNFKAYRQTADPSSNFDVNSISSLFIDSKKVLWIGSRDISRYNPVTDKLELFDLKIEGSGTMPNKIISIAENSKGWIYFLERNTGIYCFKPQENKTFCIKFPSDKSNENLEEDKLSTIWIDSKDKIYAGSENGNVYVYDPLKNSYEKLLSTTPNMAEDPVRKVVGSGGYLYIGYRYSGVVQYDIQHRTSIPIHFSNRNTNHQSLFVHDIFVENSVLWVATENGLFINNLFTKITTHFERDYFDSYSLSDNALSLLKKDSYGGMWIGSYFGGINYLPPALYSFVNKYYPTQSPNSLGGKAVREICQDKNGYIWIGTEDGGLNRFDPLKKEFKGYNNYNIHGLAIIDDHLYFGVYDQGLYIMNLKTEETKQYYISNDKKQPYSIYSICEANDKTIWLGTSKGIYLFDKNAKTFSKLNEPGTVFVHHLFKDTSGTIWISTVGKGVFSYSSTGKLVNYNTLIDNNLGFVPHTVINTYEDRAGNYWFSVIGGGLIKYNPQNTSFKHYSESNGLPNNTAYRPIEDKDGNLWFGTNRGLVYLNPVNEAIRVYTQNDGLPTNQFNFSSAFLDRMDNLYFGTTSGLITFDPADIWRQNKFPDILFVGFQLFGKEVETGKNSPLKESITQTNRIELKYDQNTIAIDFVILRYFAPQKNTCYVKLEGFDKQWNLVEDNFKLNYANLPWGEYTLRIKVTNGLGDWKESSRVLYIDVKPPFWATSWAFLIYAVMILLAVYMSFRLVKHRITKRRNEWYEAMTKEKERESYRAKIDFFIHIAHEIKTPLTLIKMPLEYILKKHSFDQDVEQSLHTIEKNTDRMLNLSYQLIDFKNIENKSFSLNLERVNICEVLEDVYDRFKLVAEQKQIVFTLNIPNEPIWADVDKESLTKIVSNLFNNALKFCAGKISAILYLSLVDDTFHILVENDGSVIPESMHEKIFEAFVQLASPSRNTGRGIGLSLARSLTELHGGTLVLDTSKNTNQFILKLPVTQDSSVMETVDSGDDNPLQKLYSIHREDDGLGRILIVEDEDELRSFMAKILSEHYDVYEAANGREALGVLDKVDINLVVSDIMMPRMNGFELLKTMKTTLYYSHIPIILLTAKANIQSKVEGLESGADSYIEKPFSFDYLLAQISSLLQNRKNLIEIFNNQINISPHSMAHTKADKEFIQKLDEVIKKNVENSQLSVDLLAEEMNMSRSTLHRKIKGITDQTPNDYIRLIKLKMAAVLLQEKKLRINEISIALGFTDSSYFTKCFQKHFGVLPKDFTKDVKK